VGVKSAGGVEAAVPEGAHLGKTSDKKEYVCLPTERNGRCWGSWCWGPSPDRDRIEQRIEEIQPTAKEHRFEAIGWVSGLCAAERLARESGRPVFLFSNVGQMDTGRC
jgi:hypothetical protein